MVNQILADRGGLYNSLGCRTFISHQERGG